MPAAAEIRELKGHDILRPWRAQGKDLPTSGLRMEDHKHTHAHENIRLCVYRDRFLPWIENKDIHFSCQPLGQFSLSVSFRAPFIALLRASPSPLTSFLMVSQSRLRESGFRGDGGSCTCFRAFSSLYAQKVIILIRSIIMLIDNGSVTFVRGNDIRELWYQSSKIVWQFLVGILYRYIGSQQAFGRKKKKKNLKIYIRNWWHFYHSKYHYHSTIRRYGNSLPFSFQSRDVLSNSSRMFWWRERRRRRKPHPGMTDSVQRAVLAPLPPPSPHAFSVRRSRRRAGFGRGEGQPSSI